MVSKGKIKKYLSNFNTKDICNDCRFCPFSFGNLYNADLVGSGEYYEKQDFYGCANVIAWFYNMLGKPVPKYLHYEENCQSYIRHAVKLFENNLKTMEIE